jgi:hypothetical protein
MKITADNKDLLGNLSSGTVATVCIHCVHSSGGMLYYNPHVS